MCLLRRGGCLRGTSRSLPRAGAAFGRGDVRVGCGAHAAEPCAACRRARACRREPRTRRSARAAFRRRSDSWVSGRGGAQQFLVRRPAHLRLWPAERSLSRGAAAIPNIRNYWSWLIELETGVILLAARRAACRARQARRGGHAAVLRLAARLLPVLLRVRHVAVSPLPVAGHPAPSRARRRDDRGHLRAAAAPFPWNDAVPHLHPRAAHLSVDGESPARLRHSTV